MKYCQVFPDLYLVNLTQELNGFRKFISSWVYFTEELTFVVDPGPKYSIAVLIDSLAKIGVKRIDYIFLTHIHIDHAGGTGKLMELYPETKVLCHPKGGLHLATPDKLWQGSLKMLGNIARAYQQIIPVPEKNIIFQDELKANQEIVKVIKTPGHAVHHLCFQFRDYLFAGEVAGVAQPLKGRIYTRPATPPKFILEISLASLDKIIALEPKTICYGHYSFRIDGLKAVKAAREQIVLWVETVREQIAEGERNWEERTILALMEKDKVFANYQYLEEDLMSREDYFIRNSIKGMKQYLEDQALNQTTSAL